MMRTAFVCLVLVACSSADPLTPDASQTPDAPVVDVADAAVDTAAPDVTPDTAPDAAVEASVDAASDANDAAVDARACVASYVIECEINGHAECVNITTGRMQADGTTLHCGACGVTCAVGFACLARVCEHL